MSDKRAWFAGGESVDLHGGLCVVGGEGGDGDGQESSEYRREETRLDEQSHEIGQSERNLALTKTSRVSMSSAKSAIMSSS